MLLLNTVLRRGSPFTCSQVHGLHGLKVISRVRRRRRIQIIHHWSQESGSYSESDLDRDDAQAQIEEEKEDAEDLDWEVKYLEASQEEYIKDERTGQMKFVRNESLPPVEFPFHRDNHATLLEIEANKSVNHEKCAAAFLNFMPEGFRQTYPDEFHDYYRR